MRKIELTKQEEMRLVSVTMPARELKRLVTAAAVYIESPPDCCDEPGHDCNFSDMPDEEFQRCQDRQEEEIADISRAMFRIFVAGSGALAREWGQYSACMTGEAQQQCWERFGKGKQAC